VLNRALGMAAFPVNLSLDGARDAIVMRAEQLCHLETELSDKKTHVHNLQRKVKSLKEKLIGKVFCSKRWTLLLKLLKRQVAVFRRSEFNVSACLSTSLDIFRLSTDYNFKCFVRLYRYILCVLGSKMIWTNNCWFLQKENTHNHTQPNAPTLIV